MFVVQVQQVRALLWETVDDPTVAARRILLDKVVDILVVAQMQIPWSDFHRDTPVAVH